MHRPGLVDLVHHFFFSSRRRHTSWNCDWSSDVCSSDLGPRPDVITGRTQKILTGYGALYVTVNEDEKGLFEVFAQIGRGGGYTASFTEGIARLVSLCLRSGVPVDEIIDQLEGIRSPRIAVDHG